MAAIERKFTLHVPSSTENLALIRDTLAFVIAYLWQSCTAVERGERNRGAAGQ